MGVLSEKMLPDSKIKLTEIEPINGNQYFRPNK